VKLRKPTRAPNFIMIDWSECGAVERTPDTLSGAWRFEKLAFLLGGCSRISNRARQSINS